MRYSVMFKSYIDYWLHQLIALLVKKFYYNCKIS